MKYFCNHQYEELNNPYVVANQPHMEVWRWFHKVGSNLNPLGIKNRIFDMRNFCEDNEGEMP